MNLTIRAERTQKLAEKERESVCNIQYKSNIILDLFGKHLAPFT